MFFAKLTKIRSPMTTDDLRQLIIVKTVLKSCVSVLQYSATRKEVYPKAAIHVTGVLDCTIDVGVFMTIIEPPHEISNNVVCATSKASDQPAHTRSLIGAFASRLHTI